MKRRNYVFTSFKNNFTLDGREGIRGAVYQQEQCPDTGRKHYQGYVEFDSPTRLSRAREILGDPSAHLESRRGTRAEAIAYCEKTDTRVAGPWYIGSFPNTGQGKSTKLSEAIEVLKEHGLKRAAEEYPAEFVKHHKGLDALTNLLAPKRLDEIGVLVLWGDTNCGKTHRAIAIAQELHMDYYIKEPDTKWWDGYNGEKLVIFDDFKPGEGTPVAKMLRILDKWPCIVEVKGGTRHLQATHFIITSNYDPQDWLPSHDPHKEALLRRLDTIEKVEQRDEVPGNTNPEPSLTDMWCYEAMPSLEE